MQQYSNNKMIQKEQLYIIKADGLDCFNFNGNGRYAWTVLYAFREIKEAFYIYISQRQFFYISKKRFDNNEEDINFIRECLLKLLDYKKQNAKANPFRRAQIIVAIITLIVCVLIILIGFIALFIHIKNQN